MKAVGRWLAKTLGTALVLVLTITALPYASKYLSAIFPDLSGAALTTSATLSHEMQQQARLITTTIDDTGVISSTTSALFIGVVQSVAIQYDYHAEIGLELSDVGIAVSGSTVTFRIPKPTILSDSLMPDYADSVINDYWYTLTESRRQKLVDDELVNCRKTYASDEALADQYWEDAVAAFKSTVETWMTAGNSRLHFEYVRAE